MYVTNQFIYSRERRHFGRQCIFSDKTEAIANILPSGVHRMNYILRNPVNASTQLSNQKALSIMETENVTYSDRGMEHREGGWPKEVNINDEESTLRYRKKIERDDAWGMQMTNLIYRATEMVETNNTSNIYQYFFNDLPQDARKDIKEQFEARQKNIFHDPIVEAPRPITIIDWAPKDLRNFLILHTNLHFNGLNVTDNNVKALRERGLNNFYVWNLESPLKPAVIAECDEMVLKAFFCPKDENWLAGGLWSGKVCVWDARTGNMPVNICPLETAHREAVASVCWVHSKTNTEFYSGSYDGSVKYWDGRNLDTSIQEILLDPVMTDEQSKNRAHGVTVLEFEYTIPVRFIIGSDMGSIFIGNRKGITPMEIFAAGSYRIFKGPVRTIERNPFFVKSFLITGDWCAKVWAEECRGAPTTLLIKKKNQILCGTWSTNRCSLFVTGDTAGELDFWDLLLQQRHPIFSLKFSHPITYAKFRRDGEYLAIGLINGDMHLLELDKALKFSTSKDKALIALMFEREQLRCRLLEARVEEIKLKKRTKGEENENKIFLQSQPQTTLDASYSTSPDELLRIVTSDLEFQDVRNNFQDIIMKVEQKRQEHSFVMEITAFEMQ